MADTPEQTPYLTQEEATDLLRHLTSAKVRPREALTLSRSQDHDDFLNRLVVLPVVRRNVPDLVTGRLIHRLEQATREGRIKLIVGAHVTRQDGWISTNHETLSLTKRDAWARFMQPGTVNAILSEHVWEHLSDKDGAKAAQICFDYLAPGGRLRIAVPDGHHPDPNYIARITPEGDVNHKIVYTVDSLTAMLRDTGFHVELREYYDDGGTFHRVPWSSHNGHIMRSAAHAPSRGEGGIRSTSIIVDAFKPHAAGAPIVAMVGQRIVAPAGAVDLDLDDLKHMAVDELRSEYFPLGAPDVVMIDEALHSLHRGGLNKVIGRVQELLAPGGVLSLALPEPAVEGEGDAQQTTGRDFPPGMIVRFLERAGFEHAGLTRLKSRAKAEEGAAARFAELVPDWANGNAMRRSPAARREDGGPLTISRVVCAVKERTL